jgi:hypothetical protein
MGWLNGVFVLGVGGCWDRDRHAAGDEHGLTNCSDYTMAGDSMI